MQFIARLALLASVSLGAVLPAAAAGKDFSHQGVAADAKRYETFLKSSWKADAESAVSTSRPKLKKFLRPTRAPHRGFSPIL